ncbi:MAG: hypothetical protein CSA04_05210 [Bacteroidetes bacterium]|nr:MAG: hypothetical protein CSA04_05210 [Bacteroidota bacterium]
MGLRPRPSRLRRIKSNSVARKDCRDRLTVKMKNDMTSVLVTCVGSGIGQSVIDSLNLSRDYYIVGMDGNMAVYAHGFCDAFYPLPRISEEGYIEYVIGKALKERVDIVIPGHDAELHLFACNVEKFHNAGLEVLISEPDLIKISRNKKEWYDYFQGKGCRIAPTFFVKDYLKQPDLSLLPAIVKPVGGSASQGVSIINRLDDLKAMDGALILQPYLFPEKSDENYSKIAAMVAKGKFIQRSEISTQLIFDRHATFKGLFISKNVLKNGVPIHIEPMDPEKFQYLDEILRFVPLLEAKGVKGPVNIQGRVTEKGIYFFEMNMRFTGITGNRAQLGFNEVAYLVNNFLGKPAKLGRYTLGKVGVRQVACTTIASSKSGNIATVLGAGSHVGRGVIKRIAKEFSKINVIARPGSMAKYQRLFKDVEHLHIVNMEQESVLHCLTESTVLINFVSALANTPQEESYEAILFIQRLLPRIVKAKIPRIVQISSQSVYDSSLDKEKTEEDALCLSTPYAFQKRMMEELFASVNDYYPHSKVVSLRLARVLDPSDRVQCGFFGRIVEACCASESLHIHKPLNRTNLLHIEDVAGAILFVLEKMDAFERPEIMNVGGTENMSIREFCEEVEKMVSSQQKIVTYGAQSAVEVASTLDCSKLRRMGWKNTKTVKDIISALHINITKEEGRD